MTNLDLTTPADALVAARATRERVRGQSPSDPARCEAVAAALEALTASWTPAHVAYMKSGRIVGAGRGADPVRVLAAERRAEVKRLRSMLQRTSGTYTYETLPPINAKSMHGRIGRSVQVVKALATEHEAICRALGRGSPYEGMGQFRREAGRLRDQLHEERLALRTAWEQYERHIVTSDEYNGGQHDKLLDAISAVRADADLLAGELRKCATRRTPLPGRRKRKMYTTETARQALQGFQSRNGRLPRKAECNPQHGLPHYTQLVRLLGVAPLTNL